MNKEDIDSTIAKYQVQPVGDGYIDLIVKRENYKKFIDEVLSIGFQVTGISWWEWCSEEERPKYGIGGPKSKFYDGWFAELPIEVDDVPLMDDPSSQRDEIFSIIEFKSIEFPDGEITFKDANFLTPAIWLEVPEDWKNETAHNKELS